MKKIRDEIGADIQSYFISYFFSFAVFLEVILGIITCYYLLDLYRCANRGSRPFLSVKLCNVSRPARGHREVFLYFCDWQSAVDEKYTNEIQRIIHRFNHRETGLRHVRDHHCDALFPQLSLCEQCSNDKFHSRSIMHSLSCLVIPSSHMIIFSIHSGAPCQNTNVV